MANSYSELFKQIDELSSSLSKKQDRISFIGKLNQLIQLSKKIVEKVPEFDFSPEVKGSGLRTFLFRFGKFIEKCLTDQIGSANTDLSFEDYENVLELFLINGQAIELSARTGLGQLQGDVETRNEISHKMLSVTESQIESMLKIGPCWLPEADQKQMLVLGQSSPSSFLDCTIADLRAMYTAIRLPEEAKKKIELHELFKVKIASKQQVQEDGSLLDIDRENLLDVHVWRDGYSEEFDGTVIFYVHGSGFSLSSPKEYNQMMHVFAKAMPGMTIVAPDYRKSPEHKYPKAVQDLFDCYQALIGTVQSELPALSGLTGPIRRIIISGDSAGGTLSLSLVRILDQVDVNVSNVQILLLNPSGPPVHETLALPARTLQITDVPILAIGPMHAFIEAYCPGGSLDPDLRPTWYRQPDRSALLARSGALTDRCLKDPIFNPVRDSLEHFGFRMTVICGHQDPLIDDAVLLARKWTKDQVRLILIDEKVHGWYLFDAELSENLEPKGTLPMIIEQIKELI